jgi:NAD(P)-dependent dehydrogenase (short-subunit alcohol dehydrogenase family)
MIIMPYAAFSSSNVAVVTGGASGIGLAAAKRFIAMNLKVCIADVDKERLHKTAEALAAISDGGQKNLLVVPADISRLDEVRKLEKTVRDRFQRVDVLMNNAGVQPGSSVFGPEANWDKVIGVNLWGVIQGTQVFAPGMIAQGSPGCIINTGSKQGITTPPGDPAYNVSKAGVKVFTEALQHELRNMEGCQVSAHLLIPGFVFTTLSAQGRRAKPAAAWTPEQTVDFMMARLKAEDFYILCPDNEVTRQTDEKRILWGAGDLVENRPPLSRWHPDYAEAFKASLKGR